MAVSRWCMWGMVALLLGGFFVPGMAGVAEAGEGTAETAIASLPDTKHVLLVLVDRMAYEDMAGLPHLQEVAAKGAVGVMNINTGGKRTDGNEFATMAAGAPTQIEGAPVLAFDAQESWGETPAWQAFRLFQAQGSNPASVLMLAIDRMHQKQNLSHFAAPIGGLGDALERMGLQAAVFGSEDTTKPWRPGAMLTTDSKGHTAIGDVSRDLLVRAPERPYGVRTDYDRIWNSYQRVRDQAALTVLDLGDLYRLSTVRSQLTPARYDALKTQTLQELDSFFGHLQQEPSKNRLVLIASPQASPEAVAKGEWLAPIVAAGGTIAPQTVLTSATTRRDGLVANFDVAPTILHFLGARPVGDMIGYPLQGTAQLSPQHLGQWLDTIVWAYTHKTLVLTLFAAFVLLGLVCALLRLLFCVGFTARIVSGLMYSALAMPLCLYVLPLLHAQGLFEVISGIAALLLLFVAIPFRILPLGRSIPRRLLWLAICTAGMVVVDAFQGGLLSKSSLLSYDPIVGARFYGVGNEYMGVVVGAVMLAFGALSQSTRLSPRAFVLSLAVVGLGLTAFFASPSLGTNTGGAVTMAGTTALLLLQQKKVKRAPALLTFLGALGIASTLLFLENSQDVPPSHIGAAAQHVMNGGLPEILRLFARKSEMFFGILTDSIWPTVLLLAAGGFAGFLFHRTNRDAKWQARYAALWRSVTSLIGGALVGLFTNDSGIAVAAMMLLFASVPAFLIWLDEQQREVEEVLDF